MVEKIRIVDIDHVLHHTVNKHIVTTKGCDLRDGKSSIYNNKTVNGGVLWESFC